MRRKISLYIADQLVDLDDQSFILFNYTMDDLSNPTIVKNSFTRQITLKGTPRNNRIFGGSYRTDRRIADTGGDSGAAFNASRKTPFVIYDRMNEILESGYVKLDSVSKVGADIQYKVTLFGGLGSFFYALSYDEDGNKRSLADLDYLGTPNPASELNFVINAQAVEDAWKRLQGDVSVSPIWDIINFAPAYNGIPDGNFAPDKALVDPLSVGLPANDPTNTYTTKGGYALVNMANKHDEWAVKDLRSYLQRPVLSMKAFWSAICNPANNGGYEVDASIVMDYLVLGHYADLWKTLPMIPTIGKQGSGDLSLSLTSTPSAGNTIGRYDMVGSVSAGTKVTADISMKVRFEMDGGADMYAELPASASQASGSDTLIKFDILFLQAVAYASDDSVVGGSTIKIIGPGIGSKLASSVADLCGYIPEYPAGYEVVDVQEYGNVSAGVFGISQEIGLSVEATDVAYYLVKASRYSALRRVTEGSGGSSASTSFTGDGSDSTPEMFLDFDNSFTALATYIEQGDAGDSVTYESLDSLRSGATVTKAMLLSTSRTPAEYMISFCKMFGLYFHYDPGTRKVTIMRRDDLYLDETIDLTKRVDISKGVSVLPMAFDAKWYDFALEGVGGAYMDEYERFEGIPYGIQKVDTGYDFDSDSHDLLEGNAFKNACTILAKSIYMNHITEGGFFIPSPFLDKGNTYTLWDAGGGNTDLPIPCPTDAAVVTYFNTNPAYKGYDINQARKLELRDADGKPLDGTDILVFLEGWNNYSDFKLTDDLPAMDTLNDGVPCWLLGEGQGVNIPIFQRYTYAGPSLVEHSLDFGIPRQADIPGVRFQDGCCIYPRAWKKYISDRYDANTKVMTCKVDFSGMRVSHDLLRKFYWYGNSLWALNAIRNYSLTTFDLVECELIQVQDKENYLNGQNYLI